MIGDLYSKAKDRLPDDRLRLGRLIIAANAARQAELEGGKQVANAVLARMRSIGANQSEKVTIGANGLKSRVDSKVTVGQAEELRQFMNELFKNADGRGKHVIGKLKNALDEDVFTKTGEDLFEQARAAKSALEKAKAVEQSSKYNKNTKSIVADLLEGKVEPEQVFNRAVLNSSASVKQLSNLRKFMLDNDYQKTGQMAWDDLRRYTLQHLVRSSTNSAATTQTGASTFSTVKFGQALDKIGHRKLSTLFSKAEMEQLKVLREISELRFPKAGTQQGKGPSAMAFESVKRKAPLIGEIIDDFINKRAQQKLINPERATVKALEKAKKVEGLIEVPDVPALGGGAAIVIDD